MTKYRVNTGTMIVEFTTMESATAYTAGTSWAVETFTEPTPTVDMAALIDKKIKGYQDSAPQLMRELYVANTLSGISTLQSDQMFDDYADVLIRIREGAFPTALRRLLLKRPAGFVTQGLLDAWVSKIQAYL